jgi:TonB family protein
MGNHATSRFDSLALNGPTNGRNPLQPTAAGEPNAGTLSPAGFRMPGRGGATSVIDLALELVINEIVQQARLATNATGAAIALMVGGKMTCRAATGATAPEVAALLNAPSGVAEACLATGTAQHCDDTETDPRFEAAACQRLGVRSLIIIPVLSQVVSVQNKKADRLGVIAIFSPVARGFGEAEVRKLQAFARRVAANVDRAKEFLAMAIAAAALPEPVSAKPHRELPAPRLEGPAPRIALRVPRIRMSRRPVEVRIPRLQLQASPFELAIPRPTFRAFRFEIPIPFPRFRFPQFPPRVEAETAAASPKEFALPEETFLPQEIVPRLEVVLPPAEEPAPEKAQAPAPEKDRMLFLRVSVVGLTLLLAWMLGWRYGVRGMVTGNRAKPPVTRVARIAPPAAAKVVVPAAADPVVALTVQPTEAREVLQASQTVIPDAMVERPTASRRAENAGDEPAAGGLVVYEGGKEIYRVQPVRHPAANDPAMPAPAMPAKKKASTTPERISEEMASNLLAERVEPQYPEAARLQRVQGAVVLDLTVGKNGVVRALHPLSGDPELAQAATDAVRQWHFKPLVRDGEPTTFETHITVSFVLR